MHLLVYPLWYIEGDWSLQVTGTSSSIICFAVAGVVVFVGVDVDVDVEGDKVEIQAAWCTSSSILCDTLKETDPFTLLSPPHLSYALLSLVLWFLWMWMWRAIFNNNNKWHHYSLTFLISWHHDIRHQTGQIWRPHREITKTIYYPYVGVGIVHG